MPDAPLAPPDLRAAATAPMPHTDPALLDAAAVAALLGCSTRHVWRMHDARLMPPACRLGRLVRWSRAAIVAWIEAGCPATKRAGRK
jgi:predicted DNA-binding transcriptional regulator AlpA